MTDETLSLLIHADSKAGKTTLVASAPPPLLILDAEGGSKFLPVRKTTWDGLRPPPAYDGSWEVCVVMVREFSTLVNVFQWLQTGQHHFRSFGIDSITEA
ncbi:MAG: AAA family ATPase, partial [Luteitalea sp.]|nr:AAA family ATPase [Luteitalea sp.]